MVFQAMLERLGFEYASVGFPQMLGPGSGHFALAVKINGQWYFQDTAKDINPPEAVLLSEVLKGDVLPSLYPGALGEKWREAAKQGRVKVKWVNQYPAPEAALFHRITRFMSWYGWLLFGLLYLISLRVTSLRGLHFRTMEPERSCAATSRC